MTDDPTPSIERALPLATLNRVSASIIQAAMAVHSNLGPGLLEGAYEACLALELSQCGLSVERQVRLPIVYKGVEIDENYRIDLFVERQIIVEVKSVVKLLPVHEAQLMSYLRLGRRRLGLLFNFNVVHMRNGIRRRLNGY